MASKSNGVPPLILPNWADRIVGANRDWVRLHDICTDIIDCPHSTPVYTETGDNFIARTQDFASGTLDLTEAARVDDETFSDRTRRTIPCHGDLIYSREGAYHGIAAEIPEGRNVCLGQRTVLIRVDPEEANFRFVRYWLNSKRVRSYVAGHKAGSAAPRINLPTIRGLPVALPPLPEQRAIASILGALDDKIELNRRMNATLDSLARAIFKSWFVDFDPVKINAGQRASSQAPATHDPTVLDVFPSTFQDSELGPIPEGWNVEELSAIAELRTDVVKPYESPMTVWEHYSIPSFDESQQPSIDLGETIKSNKYAVPENCVLVSKLNPRFPRVWLPEVRDADLAICSTEFMPFVPKGGAHRSFVLECVRSERFQGDMLSRATGSTGSRQRVKPVEVAQIRIARPHGEQIELFGTFVGSLHVRIAQNRNESRALAEQRDHLLPQLLSGDVSIGGLL